MTTTTAAVATRAFSLTTRSLFIRGRTWELFIERNAPRHASAPFAWRQTDKGTGTSLGAVGSLAWCFAHAL